MEASCCKAARFRPWRVFECLLFLLGVLGLGLYTAGCQMPIAWKGVVGPEHWVEVFVEGGDLDLLFIKVQDQDCLQQIVGFGRLTGLSLLQGEGDCGCGGCGYSAIQRPAMVFLTPDWLYDRCDAVHQPDFTFILRVPLATTSIIIVMIPIVLRLVFASRKFLRSAAFRCTECGYPLQGLPVLRCPECGQS